MGKALSRIGSSLCGVGVTVIDGSKYIKHRQLGEGAFSYVDEIEDIKDGKLYALKRIICHDSKSEKEAVAEAKATQVEKQQFLFAGKRSKSCAISFR